MSTERTERTASASEAEPEEPEPKRLRRRLRSRTDEIERREVAEAVSALDARGGLTEGQHETVRELGSALAAELTAGPERVLVRAARTEKRGERDRERMRAIRRLFALDEG